MIALSSADTHMEDVVDCAPAVGFAGVDMMLLLPKIMSYLRRDDLFRLMLVNKDFHHQAMYMLYRELWWDINDATGNHMIISLYATVLSSPQYCGPKSAKCHNAESRDIQVESLASGRRFCTSALSMCILHHHPTVVNTK